MTSNHFWTIPLLSRPTKYPCLKQWSEQLLVLGFFSSFFSLLSGSSFLCKLELCVVYRQKTWPDFQGLEKSPVSSEIAQHRPSMLQTHGHNFTFRNHRCSWALQRAHSHLDQMGSGSGFEREVCKVVTFSWGEDTVCPLQVLLAPLSCDVPSYSAKQDEIKKCSRVIKAGNNKLWKSPKPTAS